MEIWKDIERFDGKYEVSNKGRIRNGNKILKLQNDGRGYYHIGFCFKGNRHFVKIHKIVAESFVLNTENKPHINHIDGNKKNNSVENLEWVTCSENNTHAIETGLVKRKRKLIKDEVDEILNLNKTKTQRYIARKFGICQSTVRDIIKGKIYKNYTKPLIKHSV